MRYLLTAALFSAFAAAQALPPDIDSKSYSRLPLRSREQMSGDALRAYDALVGKDRTTPGLGPQATSLYSMGVAEPMDKLNQYLRNTVVGPAMFQICTLVAAREFDETYEWTSHEAGAKRSNVDMKTIDAIRFNRPLDGLPEKDALVIRFGRALFRDHKVSPELYAKVVEVFGQQGMFELTATMGDYAMAAIMLRAVDQHVPQEPANYHRFIAPSRKGGDSTTLYPTSKIKNPVSTRLSIIRFHTTRADPVAVECENRTTVPGASSVEACAMRNPLPLKSTSRPSTSRRAGFRNSTSTEPSAARRGSRRASCWGLIRPLSAVLVRRSLASY
jgi:4-carboxymuconolactone decarboxylase